ncbi:glucose-6-phosphate dehydrogenase [Polaromonas sp.]|nr:glucose-6-phosphate dehydrogenase [Candidatus Saccharibacteria bacterium]
MTSTDNQPADAPILVIFGITGDLSRRKLLPALYHIFSQELLPANTKIIGVSRRPLDVNDLLGNVELCVLEKDNVCDPEGIRRLKDALESFQLDPGNQADFIRLKDRLTELDGANGDQREHLFYMSIPPEAYTPIVEQLGKNGLNDRRSRVLLEKPFGYDSASAQALITLVDTYFSEEQVYRIDHYLAKETAQNLLTFRLYNPIFSSLWNAEHIERVEIRATETIGIEGRAEFYEKTGALRDLVQSHLLQLLAITLMDLPADMSSGEIHRTKQYFLEQLLPADPNLAVRGQYDGYKQEVQNEASTTESYARVHLKHGAERWQGVDFVLDTGKGMAEKLTEITVYFKTTHAHSSNNLTFNIQPNEGITLDLIVKAPGIENQTTHTTLDFDYQKLYTDTQHIDAYERVLMDAVRADQSLFSSDAEVLATWRVLQPILDKWSGNDDDLRRYAVGSAAGTITDTSVHVN